MSPLHPLPSWEGSHDHYARQFADRITQIRKATPRDTNNRRVIALIVFLVSIVLAIVRAGLPDRAADAEPFQGQEVETAGQHFQEMQEHFGGAGDRANREKAP